MYWVSFILAYKAVATYRVNYSGGECCCICVSWRSLKGVVCMVVLFSMKGPCHDVCLLAVVCSKQVCSVVFCSRISPWPDERLHLSVVTMLPKPVLLVSSFSPFWCYMYQLWPLLCHPSLPLVWCSASLHMWSLILLFIYSSSVVVILFLLLKCTFPGITVIFRIHADPHIHGFSFRGLRWPEKIWKIKEINSS